MITSQNRAPTSCIVVAFWMPALLFCVFIFLFIYPEMDTQKDYSSWRALPWRTNSSINWTPSRFSSPVAPFHKLLALLCYTDAGCMLCLMTLSSAVWIHQEAFSLSACKPMNYLNRSPASHYVHNYACQWFWFDSADIRAVWSNRAPFQW